MDIIAAPDRLLAKPTEIKTTIILTDKVQSTQGTIVSVGSELDNNWLNKEVIWKKFAGQELTFQKNVYNSLEIADILAIITKPA